MFAVYLPAGPLSLTLDHPAVLIATFVVPLASAVAASEATPFYLWLMSTDSAFLCHRMLQYFPSRADALICFGLVTSHFLSYFTRSVASMPFSPCSQNPVSQLPVASSFHISCRYLVGHLLPLWPAESIPISPDSSA